MKKVLPCFGICKYVKSFVLCKILSEKFEILFRSNKYHLVLSILLNIMNQERTDPQHGNEPNASQHMPVQEMELTWADKERNRRMKQEFDNMFSKQKIPERISYQHYPILFEMWQKSGLEVLGIQNYLVLQLVHNKEKNLYNLLKIFDKLAKIQQNPSELLPCKSIQKIHSYVKQNYFFFKKPMFDMLGDKYSHQDIKKFSQSIKDLECVGWLKNIFYELLIKKLNDYLESQSKEDKFLALIKDIDSSLIMDKIKLMENYVNKKHNSSKNQQSLNKLIYEACENFKGKNDQEFSISLSQKYNKTFKGMKAYLRAINTAYKYLPSNHLGQYGNSVVNAFIRNMLQERIKGMEHKNFIEYMQKEGLYEFHKFQSYLKDYICLKMEQYIKSLQPEAKQNMISRIQKIDPQPQPLLNNLMAVGQQKQFDERLERFYIGEYHNYATIDQNAQKYKQSFRKMLAKLEAKQVGYQQIMKYTQYRIIQTKTKIFGNEARKIVEMIEDQKNIFKDKATNFEKLSDVLASMDYPQAKEASNKIMEQIRKIKESTGLAKLKIPEQIQILVGKTQTLKQIRNLPLFKSLLCSSKEQDSMAWILKSLEKFQSNFNTNVNSVCSSTSTYSLQQFINYFSAESRQTISVLVKQCNKGSNQKDKIFKCLDYLDSQKLAILCNFFQGLKFLNSRVGVQELFSQKNSNHQKFIQNVLDCLNKQKSSQVNKVILQDFEQHMENLIKLLDSLSIDYQKLKENIPVEVIAKIGENPVIMDLALKMEKQQLQGMVDFITEDQEQQAAVIITEFSTIATLTNKIKNQKDLLKIMKIIEEYHSQMVKDGQLLSANIANCNAELTTITMKIDESSDRNFSFKNQMEAITKNSAIVLVSQDDWDSWEIFIKFRFNNQELKRSLKRVRDYRDKTTLFIGENQEGTQEMVKKQDIEKLELFKLFHSIYKDYQTISKAVDSLLEDGFPPQKLSKDKNDHAKENKKGQYILFQHSIEGLNQLSNKAEKMDENKKKWSQNLKKLWSQHYLASHLDGRQIQRVVNNYIKNNKLDDIFLFALGIQEDADFGISKEQIRHYLDQNEVQAIYDGYANFFRCFNQLQKEKIQMYGNNSPFLVYHEEEKNVYKIMFSIHPKVNPCDVLFCSINTKENDVQRFFIRAVKTKTPSFVINCHKLSERAQRVLFEKLSSISKSNRLFNQNLVFIETLRDHRAFQTLTSRAFNYDKRRFKDQTVDHESIKKAIMPCKVFWSEKASSGKSYAVMKEIKNLKRTSKYLSLNGEIDAKYVSRDISHLCLDKNKDALIIQVSYSHNSSQLSQILARILLFRCLQIGVSIPKQVPIYVEIANIYNYQHFERIPILRLINELQGISIKMPAFSLEAIDVENPTKQELYVFTMLSLISSGEINNKQVQEENQKVYIAEKAKDGKQKLIQTNVLPTNWKQCLKKYLFDPLLCEKESVSAHLYTVFMKKLYDNFKAFNGGFFSIVALEYTGSKKQIRSDILKIIIQNTRDFLKEYMNTSMYTGMDSSNKDFRDKLKNLGLLILPLRGGGFSFIFSNSGDVPKILQELMTTQERINPSKFEQHFSLKNKKQSDKVKHITEHLKKVAGRDQKQQIKSSQNYKLTEDNFFKMCIVLYRIQSGIPVVLMGESGVGKTSLITEMAKIIKADLKIFHVHAGKRKKEIHAFVSNIIAEYKFHMVILPYVKKFEEQRVQYLEKSQKNTEKKQKILQEKQKQSKIAVQQAIDFYNTVLGKLNLREKLTTEQLKLYLENKDPGNLQTVKINDLTGILFNLLKQSQIHEIASKQIVQDPKNSKRVQMLVLIDEYNTTEEVYTFKELIMDRRYKNSKLPDGIVFIACCNPYILNSKIKPINSADGVIGLSFKKAEMREQSKLSFKVEPPPESLRLITQDYQQLNPEELKTYAMAILGGVKDPSFIADLIVDIHERLHKVYGRSCASLRDVERFRRLYLWFKEHCPQQKAEITLKDSVCRFSMTQISSNMELQLQERVIIVTLCSCYVSKAQSESNKDEIVRCIAKAMRKQQDEIKRVYDAEQVQFLRRMVSSEKIVMNKALKENVFLMFVCIMNKIANLVIGVPGSSKSLSISLIQSNLKGKSSKSQFYRKFPEVKLKSFQASQSCTSEAIENFFNKAQQVCQKMKKFTNIIYVLMIDEIGLAEYSSDNPLKVLHSKLQLTQANYSVVGISNWTLDNAKSSRFLICSRTLPNIKQITQTATQLLKVYVPNVSEDKVRMIDKLSEIYCKFMQKWRTNQALNNGFPEFFGLRDKYSFQKYIYGELQKNQVVNISTAINMSIKMNFDGQNDSAKTFIELLSQVDDSQKYAQLRKAANIGSQMDPIQQCKTILETKGSRCIMLIIPSDVLVPIISQHFSQAITLHGSNFEEDRLNQDYNLSKIAQITSYVARPNLIVMKDMNESIYTSLYDLFNKNYTESGNKKYCRVASGANMRRKVEVSDDFKAVLFVYESDILRGRIDSAFLNRFCKIYFKISRFIQEKEFEIVKNVQAWLKNVVKSVAKETSNLNVGNFFVNCSQNALFSLVISLREANLTQEQKKQTMRRILMQNKTFQLQLAMKHNLIRIQGVDSGVSQVKNKNKIIYTYDQSCEFEDHMEGQPDCYTVHISKIRQQKTLNHIMAQFLRKKQKTMKIKLNYETHSHIFNELVFKINETIKTNEVAQGKTFVIVVLLKRNKLSEMYPCISYLHPYQQQFRPLLAHKTANGIDLTRILEAKNYLDLYQAYHTAKISEVLENFMPKVWSRIKPIYKVGEGELKKMEEYWNWLKNNLHTNIAFKQYAQEKIIEHFKNSKIDGRLIQKYFKDNQINSRCSSVNDSLHRFTNKMLIDAITSLLVFVLKKGLISQFDRKYAAPLLTTDEALLEKINRNIPALDKLFNLLGQKRNQKVFGAEVKRDHESNPVEVHMPVIFPYMQVQLSYYINQTLSSEQELNQNSDNIGDSDNLQSKCAQLFIQTRLKLENNSGEEGTSSQLDALLRHALNEFRKKSIFLCTSYNLELDKEQIIWDYLPQLMCSQNREPMELFLYDLVTKIYGDHIKQISVMQQVHRLAVRVLEDCKYRLDEALVALCADTDMIKTLCTLVAKLRQNGFGYYFKGNFIQKNSAMIPRSHVCQLIDHFFKEGLMMGSQRTLGNFGSAENYVNAVLQIDQLMKKIQKQKYLKVQIPRQFILLSRWLNRVRKIVGMQNIGDYIKRWIDFKKKKGFYEAVLQISYSICKKDNTSKQLQDLYQLLGLKIFYFWYMKQVMPAANEDDKKYGQLVASFCMRMYQFCEISCTFAQSLNPTLDQMFNIRQEGAIKNLRQFQQHLQNKHKQVQEQEDGQLIDEQLVANLNKYLQNHNSNLSRILNNYGYYNFSNFQQISEQKYENQWKAAFDRIKKAESLTSLTLIFNFAFCKHLMKFYSNEIINEQANEFTAAVNRSLSQCQTKIAESLGVYAMKCLRSKFITLNQFKTWTDKKIASWMEKELYKKIEANIQIQDPPRVTLSQQYITIIDQLIGSSFSEKNLNELLSFKHTHEELYWTITTFMKHLYAKPHSEIHGRVKEKISNSKYPQLVKKVIISYCDKNLSLQFSIGQLSQVEAQKFYMKQFPFLNILNWFVALSQTQNPLIGSFVEKGQFPSNYKEFMDKTYMVCGVESPYRTNLKNMVKFSKRDIGVYKCSSQCDYIFTHLACGYPNQKFTCPVCKKPSGGSHNLEGLERGAKRFGPSLYLNKQGTEFSRQRHQKQAKIYLWDLTKHESYWRSFPFYIEKQELQLSNKQKTKVEQNGELKLTGYVPIMGEHELGSIERINQYSREILTCFSSVIMYFATSFDWIKKEQIQTAFLVSKDKFKDQQLKQAQQLYKGLSLKIVDFFPWFSGISREIFKAALNYPQQCQLLNVKKSKQIDEVIEIAQNQVSSKEDLQKRLIQEVIIPDLKILKKNLKNTWETTTVYPRQNFEQIIDTKVIGLISNEKRIQFIQEIGRSIQSSKQNHFDHIFMESEPAEKLIGKYPFINHISCVRELPHEKSTINDEDTQKWLKCYLTQLQNYKLLGQIIAKPELSQKLAHYNVILCFLSNLMNICDRKISRQYSKKEKICDYFLKLQETQQIQMKKQFEKFKQSWSYFLSQNGKEIQYGCKVLGKFSPLNENNQLKYFLADSKEDVKNPAGLAIHYALMLIASDYNKQLAYLYKLSSKAPALVRVDPGNVTANLLVNIDLKFVRQKIQTYTSYGCRYGQMVGKAAYGAVLEDFQDKFLNNGYYLQQQLPKIRQIVFQGQNMLSDKYTTCLEDLKKSPDQHPLPEKLMQELKNRYKEELTHNQDGFYNKCLDCLDSLQIIMIYYKTFSEPGLSNVRRDATIGNFICQKSIKKQVSALWEDKHYGDISLSNLVSLYELIEEAIAHKAEAIIPDEYRQPIEQNQWKVCKNYIDYITEAKNQKITLELLYKANIRMIYRRMLNFNASMTEHTVGISLTRSEYWPNQFTEQCWYEMTGEKGIKIKITQYFSFYLYLRQKIEKKMKITSSRAGQDNSKNIQIVKKEEVKQNTKKPKNRQREANNMDA